MLLLAVINEDIMPGYTLVLVAMLLAGTVVRPAGPRAAWRWSARSSPLGWLVEWRLIFPTLPALVLALASSAGRSARRAGADRRS